MAQQYCSSFGGNPVLPASANLQCGLRTLNHTRMQSCCNGTVQEYQTCTLYCEPKGNLQDFVSCVSGGNDIRTDAFCQRNIQSTLRYSLTDGKSGGTSSGTSSGGGTSFGVRSASSPKISTLLVITILASFFLASPASATIIPSLDPNGLSRRDASTCTFIQDSHYNQTGQTLIVSADFDCSGDSFCTFGGPISTGMTSNNRTLNGTSAADAKYDGIFDMLANSARPKRLWPAMSGASLFYGWAAFSGSTTTVGWTVLQYCVNGTIKGCAGVLGDYNGPMTVEACGPVFTNDGTGLPNGNVDIEGVLGVVSTS